MAALTHGDAQDLLDAFKRGWENRDPETIVGLFRRDAEYRQHPFSEPLQGSNAIRAHWNALAGRQAHVDFEAERIWLSGQTVLASWHAAYTRRSDGERVRVRGFMTLELDDDGTVWRLRQWPLEQVVGIDSTFRAEGQGS